MLTRVVLGLIGLSLFCSGFVANKSLGAAEKVEVLSAQSLYVEDNKGLPVLRHYLVYQPNGTTNPKPLVLVFHGYSSSAQTIMDYSGFNQLADAHGFVVYYPEGIKDVTDNQFFNVGYEMHQASAIDDLRFVDALINEALGSGQVKADAIFATGMSNGGDLSYLLACERAEQFRAVAPIAGMMMVATRNRCSPARAIPILAVSGMADGITKYAGDLENKDGWGAYLGQDETIDFWVEMGKRQLVRKDTLPSKTARWFAGSSSIERYHYASDAERNDLMFYQVVDGGHDWPGAILPRWSIRTLLAVQLMGFGKNRDIDTSHEIWSFFSAQSESIK